MKLLDPANFEYCHGTQKRIVNNDAVSHILVNGCAGCRKTQTLVFRAIRELHKGNNVLILTFVGSVAFEIVDRIEKLIDAKFRRIGNHHILSPATGNTLEIANYDAMIHKQLSYQNCLIVYKYGDWYNRKTQELLKKVQEGIHKDFILQNDVRANYLLVDEFQDMKLIQAQILATILKNNPKIKSMVLGDYLQSIFEAEGVHAMDYWRDELRPTQYQMKICFRCPPSHIGLSNILLAKQRRDMLIPNMEYPEGQWERSQFYKTRPIAFTHPPLSGGDNPKEFATIKTNKNTNADVLANQIVNALKVLYKIDPFQPQDVCVIMSRVNENLVFIQLKQALNRFYQKLGWGSNRVIHFETQTGDNRYSIDWDSAHGKTVLASIHGIKGKGFPIVFFLGLTEGALPMENHLFKPEELIDFSLLNVALTRSTKWLFIGFAGGKPSRYLFQKWKLFSHSCCFSWNYRYQITPEEKLLSNALFSREFSVLPNNNWRIPFLDWKYYQKEKVDRPNKLVNTVKRDILTSFTHPKDLEPHWPDGTKFQFGVRQDIPEFPEKDMNLVWGTLANLLLMREHAIKRGETDKLQDQFGFFTRPWENIYIPLDKDNGEGDKFLNIVCDLEINFRAKDKNIDLDEYKQTFSHAYSEYQRYIDGHPILKQHFDNIKTLTEPKIILPEFLRKNSFLIDAGSFTNPTTDLFKLSARVVWNMAVAYSFVHGEIRRPQIAEFFNYGNKLDLQPIYRNIRALLDLRRERLNNWQFERLHFLGDVEYNPETLKSMGLDENSPAIYGLKGYSDIIDMNNLTLYEIKNSVGNKDGFSNSWAVQSISYLSIPLVNLGASFGPRVQGLAPHWNYLEIVDIRQGTMWRFNINWANNEPNSFRPGLVIHNILTKLKYIEKHRKKLLGKLKGFNLPPP